MSGNFIGVDPDMHFVSFWLISAKGIPITHHTVEINKKAIGRNALVELALGNLNHKMFDNFAQYGSIDGAAVESQELYQFGAAKTKNPKSIMQLATAAGILLEILALYTRNLYFPAPQAWKGSVPKAIHQARICSRVGWKYETVGGPSGYCVPDLLDVAPTICHPRLPSHWKHSMDSIGLALYAREQFNEEVAREARKQ